MFIQKEGGLVSGVGTEQSQLQGPGASVDGPGTVVSTDGWNGAEMVRIKNSGTGTCTATIEGAFTSNATDWYAVGYQQVDGIASPVRSVAGIAVTASPFTHVYQVLDIYPWLRVRLSGTAGTTAIDALIYKVAL